MHLRAIFSYLTILCFLTLFFKPIDSDAKISADAYKSESKSVQTIKFDLQANDQTLDIEIHFEDRDEEYARRVAQILKRKGPFVLKYFKYTPQDTVHFNIDNKIAKANGLAQVFPSNIVKLYTFPPLFDEYLTISDDWIESLVIHEFIHIIHMDYTRGFLDGLRSVFGSISKLGGLVPTWFSEGIATWGESVFTTGGRLKNQILRFELFSKLASGKFCQTIDCLSQPGLYPFGQFGYWVGAYFFDFLERKKRSTVQCLVTENSNNVPFILNDAFYKCTGKSAQASFAEFIAMINKVVNRWEDEFDKSNSRPYDIAQFSSDFLLQYGWDVIDENIVFVKGNGYERVKKLAIYNPESEELIEKDISGSVETLYNQTASSKRMGKFTFPILSFQIKENEPNVRRSWVNYNFKEQSFEERENPSFGNPEYILQSSLGEIYIDIEDFQWKVYLGDKLIHQFEKLDQLSRPIVYNNQLSLRLKKVDGQNYYQSFKINKTSLSREFNLPLEDGLTSIGTCDQYNFFKNRKSNLIVFNSKNKTMNQLINADNIVSLRADKNNIYTMQRGTNLSVFRFKGSCSSFLGKFKAKKYKSDLAKTSKTVISTKEEKQSYFSLSHFYPKYWFLGYNGSAELYSFSAYTGVTDPQQIHNLNASISYYPRISEDGTDVSYSVDFFDLMNMSFAYSQNYVWSSIRNGANSSESTGATIYKAHSFGNLSWVYGPGFLKSNTSDFISKRKSEKYSFYNQFSLIPSRPDSFINGVNLKINAYKQYTRGRTNFYGGQAKLATQLYFSNSFKIDLSGSVGHLDKDEFGSGVLYAGERPSWNESPYHEFYGINYSDAYGNDVITGRAQFDLTLSRQYSGSGLFPLYVKEWHIIGGLDYLKTDFAFLGNAFYRDPEWTSANTGLRVEADIFYRAPVVLDIVFSKILEIGGEDAYRLTYFLKTGFDF